MRAGRLNARALAETLWLWCFDNQVWRQVLARSIFVFNCHEVRTRCGKPDDPGFITRPVLRRRGCDHNLIIEIELSHCSQRLTRRAASITPTARDDGTDPQADAIASVVEDSQDGRTARRALCHASVTRSEVFPRVDEDACRSPAAGPAAGAAS